MRRNRSLLFCKAIRLRLQIEKLRIRLGEPVFDRLRRLQRNHQALVAREVDLPFRRVCGYEGTIAAAPFSRVLGPPLLVRRRLCRDVGLGGFVLLHHPSSQVIALRDTFDPRIFLPHQPPTSGRHP